MQFQRKHSFLIFLILAAALLVSACTRSASSSSSISAANNNDSQVFDFSLAAATLTAQAGGMDEMPEGVEDEEAVTLPTLAPPTDVPTEAPAEPTKKPTKVKATEEEVKQPEKEKATATPEATRVEKVKEITPLPTSEVSVPRNYTLKKGESPFCIARRFDIDINAILDTNGLWLNQYYEAGLVLTLPRDAEKFDGKRQLLEHPENYVVQQGDTFFTIACDYGDVYPESIAEANGMDVGDKLEAGKTIYIP